MREIHHSYTLTADVSVRAVTTIPLQPLCPTTGKYNWHFASESHRVAVITTTIRMIRPTAHREGNRGGCAGGGSTQLEGGKGAAWFAS